MPPNTTAKVKVPANTQKDIKVNGAIFIESAAIKLVNKTENAFIFDVKPGTYSFETNY